MAIAAIEFYNAGMSLRNYGHLGIATDGPCTFNCLLLGMCTFSPAEAPQTNAAALCAPGLGDLGLGCPFGVISAPPRCGEGDRDARRRAVPGRERLTGVWDSDGVPRPPPLPWFGVPLPCGRYVVPDSTVAVRLGACWATIMTRLGATRALELGEMGRLR